MNLKPIAKAIVIIFAIAAAWILLGSIVLVLSL